MGLIQQTIDVGGPDRYIRQQYIKGIPTANVALFHMEACGRPAVYSRPGRATAAAGTTKYMIILAKDPVLSFSFPPLLFRFFLSPASFRYRLLCLILVCARMTFFLVIYFIFCLHFTALSLSSPILSYEVFTTCYTGSIVFFVWFRYSLFIALPCLVCVLYCTVL